MEFASVSQTCRKHENHNKELTIEVEEESLKGRILDVIDYLRHSFVSRISRTKGLAMARHLARHNTIEVSQRYDHRNMAELRAAMGDDVA